MSNAFMGQRQQASPMGYGGYSGGYDPFGGGGYGGGGMGGYGSPFGGGMGGYGNNQPRPQPYNPATGRGFGDGGMGGYGGGFDASRDFSGMGGFGGFGGGMGGYGTQFGGYDMGGGGGFGGFGGGMRAPAYQPTINDAFSSYFSNQYYGGNAFNPFAATSMFGGGGYGGGFGGGGGGRRGGGARRRRQMFEDLFQPEQPPQSQPQPQPQPMPIGGGAYQPGVGNQRIEMGPVTPPRVPPATAAQLQQAGASSSGVGPVTWSQMTSNQRQKYLQDGGTAPGSPAAQGFDSIMPVQQQDTPVQSAPMFYEPPQMQSYAPSPFASPFSRPGRDMFTDSFGYGMR